MKSIIYLNLSNRLYYQYSSFGPTVQIAKRWLYSQFLDQHLWPDECTEMLIAHQYLYSKLDAPCQPQTGFFRFLHMLAYANWKTDIVLLNFNDDISAKVVSKLEMKFISDRGSFPPLCIATSTGDTDKHVIWTKKVPTVEVLARVTLLARHAINLVQSTLLTKFEAKVGLFSFFVSYTFVSSEHVYHIFLSKNLQQYFFLQNLVTFRCIIGWI